MKTKFLLVAILFLSLKSFSQNYIPMNLDTSCFWVMSKNYFDGIYSCNYESLTYIERDTIINSNNYFKVITYTTSHFVSCNQGILGSLLPKITYVREDTALKKVYNMGIWGGQENVLLDFNYQTGDSTFCNAVVDSTTIENINSINRKKYWMHYEGPTPGNPLPTIKKMDFVEGIGSLDGFPFTNCGSSIGNSSILTCYSKGNQILYGNTFWPCIKKPAIAVSTKDVFKNNFTLTYSNNSFQINNPNNEKLKIVLLDLMGNKIISETTNFIYYQSNIANSISTGIYFLQVGNEKGRVVKKIGVE